MTQRNLNNTVNSGYILSVIFAFILLIVGILNIFLVHPVPGLVYLFLSLLYIPQANEFLKEKFGLPVPAAVKIILGIAIIMFTLGVSDLGDMIDKW